MKNYFYVYIILLSIVLSQSGTGSILYRSDLLNENPLYPIPDEMTFEEYQDMNRRLGVGLLLSAIPIPGTIHSYAGEKHTAKKIRWIAAGSIFSILIGLSSYEEGDWETTPYQIYTINQGKDDEKRYEMVPIGSIGTEIEYRYVPINKTSGSNVTNFLIPLGISVLVIDYLYDYINGIKIIENKRDKVRYKYGKQLDFSFEPKFDLNKQMFGINFSYHY